MLCYVVKYSHLFRQVPKTMTTRPIRTRDRGLAILTGPPRPSSPLPTGREKAPPPSFDDLRTVDGWSPLLLPPKPLYFLQQHRNADRQLSYSWQPAFEVKSPNGHLNMLEPARTPRFDPRSMLWWSQWEIVFAKRAVGLSDEDTCSVFKYRWREMDKSTKYMQPYHVTQIMEILSDGHPVRPFLRVSPSSSKTASSVAGPFAGISFLPSFLFPDMCRS